MVERGKGQKKEEGFHFRPIFDLLRLIKQTHVPILNNVLKYLLSKSDYGLFNHKTERHLYNFVRWEKIRMGEKVWLSCHALTRKSQLRDKKKKLLSASSQKAKSRTQGNSQIN